jgi:hypothetical protein
MGEDKQATLLDLIDQLYDNLDSLSDFHNGAKFHQAALVANFTQGEILRFRHGSAQEIFRQTIKIREACQYCGSLPTENNFSSRKYFLLTAKYLDNLIKSEFLFVPRRHLGSYRQVSTWERKIIFSVWLAAGYGT